MKKVTNKKGFTLAELLIVVAIIAVLVAIAIPVFGTALDKAHVAADTATIRGNYAEAIVNAMTANTYTTGATAGTVSVSVEACLNNVVGMTTHTVGANTGTYVTATFASGTTTAPGSIIIASVKDDKNTVTIPVDPDVTFDAGA